MAEMEAERLMSRAWRAGVQPTPAEATVVDPTEGAALRRRAFLARSGREGFGATVALLDLAQVDPDRGLV